MGRFSAISNGLAIVMRRDRTPFGRSLTRVALTVITLAVGATVRARDVYHVSPGGDDRNDGKTPATAWRTAARVNREAFAPGDQILFAKGGEWRECLVPAAGGNAARPITFGTYGAGPKPKFWGSDLLDKGAFRPATGGVFKIAAPRVVHAVLVDHRFLRSSRLLTKSDDTAVNLDYVRSHPGFWHFHDGALSINASGVDPRTDPRDYSAVVRDDVVTSNGKDHLVFRDLVVDETARVHAGYGFRIIGSEDVRLEGCEAYRCGKHHFGIINSTGFVGADLYAAHAMPDQGVGGASAFVSYSDRGRRGDSSQYLRCLCEHMEDTGTGGRYPAFVTHGEGIGAISLDGLTSRGGDVALGNQESGALIRVKGGRLEGAVLAVYGEKIVVDGMTIAGAQAGVALEGAENVLQNLLIVGANPGYAGHQAAITEGGRGNTIRFCTVVMDPKAPDFNAVISLKRRDSKLRWYGNIMVSTGTIVRAWFDGFDPKAYDASFNFYSEGARFDTRFAGHGSLYSLDQWKALGVDSGSRAGDPQFAAPARDDYRLSPASPAVDAAKLDAALAEQAPLDLLGRPRLQGRAFDMGAFESPRNPAPPSR